jgi:hypothetical protein
MGIKPINQTRSGIQNWVSQKSYEGEVQKKVKKLEEDKDFEEIEEEEGTYLERGEGTPAKNNGTPQDKNRKIESEKILDKNKSPWPVYKYEESDMGPFKVYICHGSDPKNDPSVVPIGRLLEKLGTDYRRVFQAPDNAGQCSSARTTLQTVW